jgi:type II secretion system protein J
MTACLSMDLGSVGRGSRRAAVLCDSTRLGRSLALPGSWSSRMALRPRALSVSLPAASGRACRRAAAFTLIEILLAVAIFSIVLAGMHLVFHGALRLRNKTTASLEAAVPLQHALSVIEHDLANIVIPGTNIAGALQTTPTNTATRVLGQVSPPFYTAVGFLNDSVPWSEVQRVTYRLTESTNGTPGLDLYRSVTRNLLALVEDAPEDQFLLGGVETVTFQFYDGTQWRYDWDSTTEATILPGAIKVELLLTAALTNRFSPDPIVLVVPITVQPDTNTVAQTTESGT